MTFMIFKKVSVIISVIFLIPNHVVYRDIFFFGNHSCGFTCNFRKIHLRFLLAIVFDVYHFSLFAVVLKEKYSRSKSTGTHVASASVNFAIGGASVVHHDVAHGCRAPKLSRALKSPSRS